MDEGALDLIFAKRRAGDGRGRMVWREEMVWIAAPDWRRDPERPLPLVLYPPRSITREAVLAALEKADIPWRIACTCGSLSGLVGAVVGGLGVGAQSARLKAEGTVAVGPEAGLPPLGETEFVVVPALGRPGAPVQAMADTILEFGQAFQAQAAGGAGFQNWTARSGVRLLADRHKTGEQDKPRSPAYVCVHDRNA